MHFYLLQINPHPKKPAEEHAPFIKIGHSSSETITDRIKYGMELNRKAFKVAGCILTQLTVFPSMQTDTWHGKNITVSVIIC